MMQEEKICRVCNRDCIEFSNTKRGMEFNLLLITELHLTDWKAASLRATQSSLATGFKDKTNSQPPASLFKRAFSQTTTAKYSLLSSWRTFLIGLFSVAQVNTLPHRSRGCSVPVSFLQEKMEELHLHRDKSREPDWALRPPTFPPPWTESPTGHRLPHKLLLNRWDFSGRWHHDTGGYVYRLPRVSSTIMTCYFIFVSLVSFGSEQLFLL